MKMPLSLFPSWTKEQYNLNKLAKNGFVYLEMRRAVWGLPQAGILANKLLQKRLLPHGYYECKHTPGLWRHLTRPISFTLVVDDFRVKYVGREHVNHLIKCIKIKYELTEDWLSDLRCGIKLHWDYIARTVDISMPDISRNSSKNTSIRCPPNHKIARTRLHQNDMGPKHKPHSQSTSPPNNPTTKLKKFNESSEAFCITHERSTSRSSWPSVQSQANKHEAPQIRW
jgi:hypothetical protein